MRELIQIEERLAEAHAARATQKPATALARALASLKGAADPAPPASETIARLTEQRELLRAGLAEAQAEDRLARLTEAATYWAGRRTDYTTAVQRLIDAHDTLRQAAEAFTALEAEGRAEGHDAPDLAPGRPHAVGIAQAAGGAAKALRQHLAEVDAIGAEGLELVPVRVLSELGGKAPGTRTELTRREALQRARAGQVELLG
jgi:hypothetical protein